MNENFTACRPLYEQELDTDDLRAKYVADNELLNDARGYLVDIWVYDDHCKKAKVIKVILADLYVLLFDL